MTTPGSDKSTPGPTATRPYHVHRNQWMVQTAQVPPGVPQAPGSYSLSNRMGGPVPPLSNAYMNGIGPGGPPPPPFVPPYGPANPITHLASNDIPGHTVPPGPSEQPFPRGMVGGPLLGPQQRLPNGGPPYQSLAIAPFPHSQGNPQQPLAGPMSQLGRSPHMSTINRAAMPPPTGSLFAQGTGSAYPIPTFTFLQLGRPSDSFASSSRNPVNPHPSPALGGRMYSTVEQSHMDRTHHTLDAELASYPPYLISEAKLRANLDDRNAQSLTVEEKQRIIMHAEQLRQNQPQSSGVSGPAEVDVQGRLQNRGPMTQPPMQQQVSLQQQRVGKRTNTSSGEEHQTFPRNDQSPPDRKRQRMTALNPTEQQQQQQQQQQSQSQSQPPLPQLPQLPHPAPWLPQQQQQQQQHPPMAPIGPHPSGLQPISGVGSVRSVPMTGGLPVAPPSQAPSGSGGPSTHQMGQPNTPLNQAGSTSMPTPLLNSVPPMNPQPPPMASALLPTPAFPSLPPTPGPMADLSFDMDDMFGNIDGDFDFGPDSLSDMHLWFDPVAVEDSAAVNMKKQKQKPRFNSIRKSNPWFDPIVVHDGPSLDTT